MIVDTSKWPRVLVCGGRNFTDYGWLEEEIQSICIDRKWYEKAWFVDGGWAPTVTFISGMAKGADSLIVHYANITACPILKFPADWDTYGKAAGFICNQQMIDEGKPDLVVAFPGGRGTADMVRRAKKAGIEVIEITDD